MEEKIKNKIHILFPFQKGPKGGGGNQFLKALRYFWKSMGVYENDIEKADIVLFNSHQWIKKAIKIKKRFPSKIFIHRIDGPMQTYRPREAFLDNLIFKINKFVADGVVWQSKWSQNENKKLFPYQCRFEAVVHNAPNEQIFNKKDKPSFKQSNKVKLIAVSWSNSQLKGFDVYKYLDENLDFKKYQMTFIGRSPITLKNIQVLEAMEQAQLAKQIKQHDIFITASKIEACSNVLIEALSCGLPCLAFNASSNPEVIAKGGEVFDNNKDLLLKIDKIVNNYTNYQKNLPVFSLKKVANSYFDFANKICQDAQSGFYTPREVGIMAKASFLLTNFLAIFAKIFNKLKK